MIELSEDLLPIFELELELGNELLRIDRNQWSDCPYSVIFRHPLHVQEIRQRLVLRPCVFYWECHDTHYELEAGFSSEASKHSVAGPLP